MQQQEALDLARSFARSQGYNPDRYKVQVRRRRVQWIIEFLSREDRPRPGDFFTVYIDDPSGRVERLVPGK